MNIAENHFEESTHDMFYKPPPDINVKMSVTSSNNFMTKHGSLTQNRLRKKSITGKGNSLRKIVGGSRNSSTAIDNRVVSKF